MNEQKNADGGIIIGCIEDTIKPKAEPKEPKANKPKRTKTASKGE